jgi:hypothetical protein
MFKVTRALAMQPTRMMMMRPTQQLFMKASPQLFMRETLRMRTPTPVCLMFFVSAGMCVLTN